MKKTSLLAWLLCMAMLTMNCVAYAQEQGIELNADVAREYPVEIGEEAMEDIGLDGLDGLDVELPDLEMDDGLSVGPDGAGANGTAPHVERLQLTGDAIDNDRLFAGYVDLLFGKRPQGDVRRNGFVGDTLKGMTKKLYDYLLKEIRKVTAGSESSTVFWIPASIADWNDWGAYNSSIIDAEYALVMDYPYDLFWYHRFKYILVGYNEYGNLYVMFTVAPEYADWGGYTYGGNCFTTDTAKLSAARTAARNAKQVVRRYAGQSDYNKLCGYRDYICAHVDYYYEAYEDKNYPYINPWQLIWAFDNDPGTNVICEGFTKAFQYLCDLSSFNGDIQSIMVVGDAIIGGGGGLHMWNIVTMEDGKNYHVDITFVDGGMTGAFLCGGEATGKANEYRVKDEVTYSLNAKTVHTYPAKRLKVSTRDYIPGRTVEPRSVKLKKGTATLKNGQKLGLKRGSSLTLKAVVSPGNAVTRLTWTSSSKYVTVKNGKVTVNRKAKAGTKAKITVKTANEKRAYIYIVVK